MDESGAGSRRVTERHEFVLSCRVYRTERGLAGQPDEVWIRKALSGAAR
jgi:hypothetical protein